MSLKRGDKRYEQCRLVLDVYATSIQGKEPELDCHCMFTGMKLVYSSYSKAQILGLDSAVINDSRVSESLELDLTSSVGEHLGIPKQEGNNYVTSYNKNTKEGMDEAIAKLGRE